MLWAVSPYLAAVDLICLLIGLSCGCGAEQSGVGGCRAGRRPGIYPWPRLLRAHFQEVSPASGRLAVAP